MEPTVVASIIAATIAAIGSVIAAIVSRSTNRSMREHTDTLSETLDKVNVAARKSLQIEEQLKQVNRAVNMKPADEPRLYERVTQAQEEIQRLSEQLVKTESKDSELSELMKTVINNQGAVIRVQTLLANKYLEDT